MKEVFLLLRGKLIWLNNSSQKCEDRYRGILKNGLARKGCLLYTNKYPILEEEVAMIGKLDDLFIFSLKPHSRMILSLFQNVLSEEIIMTGEELIYRKLEYSFSKYSIKKFNFSQKQEFNSGWITNKEGDIQYYYKKIPKIIGGKK